MLTLFQLVIVLDEESRDADLESRLLNQTSSLSRSRLEFNPPSIYYDRVGHDRQQLIMFWADNFTDAEFVGFVDTDSFFHAPVDKEDIFAGLKNQTTNLIARE